MIINKKLFIITLVVGLFLCAGIEIPVLVFEVVKIDGVALSQFLIINAAFSVILYTFIYKSLKKTRLIKRIYFALLVLAVAVFLLGLVMFFTNL